ncbi:hypothetical protein [Neoroseomonas rubea]|uniref:hypothetical protein n=1 Tax=Neoroseomonas rubea TaxID=2748666 RepID=UPI0018E011BA|nr:hypothetical protein [Roseomonas rubea]
MRTRLRVRRRMGVAAFLLIVTVLILVGAPETSLERLICAVRVSWLPAVVLGMFLSTLAVDVLTWARYWLGFERFTLDVRLGAGLEGGGTPVFYSRRAKWLVAYPIALIMTFLFLRFADAPACS